MGQTCCRGEEESNRKRVGVPDHFIDAEGFEEACTRPQERRRKRQRKRSPSPLPCHSPSPVGTPYCTPKGTPRAEDQLISQKMMSTAELIRAYGSEFASGKHEETNDTDTIDESPTSYNKLFHHSLPALQTDDGSSTSSCSSPKSVHGSASTSPTYTRETSSTNKPLSALQIPEKALSNRSGRKITMRGFLNSALVDMTSGDVPKTLEYNNSSELVTDALEVDDGFSEVAGKVFVNVSSSPPQLENFMKSRLQESRVRLQKIMEEDASSSYYKSTNATPVDGRACEGDKWETMFHTIDIGSNELLQERDLGTGLERRKGGELYASSGLTFPKVIVNVQHAVIPSLGDHRRSQTERAAARRRRRRRLDRVEERHARERVSSESEALRARNEVTSAESDASLSSSSGQHRGIGKGLFILEQQTENTTANSGA